MNWFTWLVIIGSVLVVGYAVYGLVRPKADRRALPSDPMHREGFSRGRLSGDRPSGYGDGGSGGSDGF